MTRPMSIMVGLNATTPIHRNRPASVSSEPACSERRPADPKPANVRTSPTPRAARAQPTRFSGRRITISTPTVVQIRASKAMRAKTRKAATMSGAAGSAPMTAVATMTKPPAAASSHRAAATARAFMGAHSTTHPSGNRYETTLPRQLRPRTAGLGADAVRCAPWPRRSTRAARNQRSPPSPRRSRSSRQRREAAKPAKLAPPDEGRAASAKTAPTLKPAKLASPTNVVPSAKPAGPAQAAQPAKVARPAQVAQPAKPARPREARQGRRKPRSPPHTRSPPDRAPDAQPALPGTRDELMALHRETRARRNKAAHGSPEHVAAIDLLGKIEVEIAAIERAMDPPLG